MFDDVLHITEAFNAYFPQLHGAVRDDFFKGFEILVWAEALTAIGAAFAKRMIPLRTMPILNNMFGVAAGIGSGSLSTFIEHAVNLPLNAVRLREMRRLIKSVREASGNDWKIEWLKPFMHPRALKAGSRVFSKGDEAKEAFVLVEGRMLIPGSSAAIQPGAIFGEMALFTAAGRRMASAVCASDVRLLVITYEQFEQLYFQNPEFGLRLVRLIVRRFKMNHAALGGASVSATG
jgi:CRP/FNR family transcriptional regulator, cyclic AMP receptor protein